MKNDKAVLAIVCHFLSVHQKDFFMLDATQLLGVYKNRQYITWCLRGATIALVFMAFPLLYYSFQDERVLENLAKRDWLWFACPAALAAVLLMVGRWLDTWDECVGVDLSSACNKLQSFRRKFIKLFGKDPLAVDNPEALARRVSWCLREMQQKRSNLKELAIAHEVAGKFVIVPMINPPQGSFVAGRGYGVSTS